MFISSIAGLYNSLAQLEKGAIQVNQDEIIDGLINSYEAVRAAKANIAVIRTEDQMLGTVLDLFA